MSFNIERALCNQTPFQGAFARIHALNETIKNGKDAMETDAGDERACVAAQSDTLIDDLMHITPS